LGVLDQDPQNLTPDSLLRELQQHVHNPLLGHTCQKLIGYTTLPSDMKISTAIFGGVREPTQDRRWRALWQLFLTTATGFGTPKDPRLALRILEDASTSGFAAVAKYVLYATYTKQQVNPHLPLRTWLVTLVLFSAGIPSDSFSALRQLDLPLSKLVAIARSQLYNGSTASFENLKFNSLHPRDNPGCEMVPGFIFKDGPHLIQDELFENTLLHLAAGSQGADLSMISYCIDVLEIDIDARNACGVTPLLLASRAGREGKILALLKLGADVNLKYECGETPLHWLGLLSDPSRVLDEFINRGADINAQVEKPRLLPNFIDGTSRFFMAAGPLVWAMAMENEAYVEALLRSGADLHCLGPTGMSAIGMACWPRLSRFLLRLSREKTFKMTAGDTYNIIASWSRWNEMGLIVDSVEPVEQEEALELALQFSGPFHDVKEVYSFYRHLVSEAISESRIGILEIIFKGLISSMEAVRNPTRNHSDYVTSPFSHPLWDDHYFAHEAARRGDTEVLRAVLQMNVDAAAIDTFGWTALHMLSSNSDNPDCVDVLISKGALEILDTRLPGWGLSAFMNAVASCNFNVADRLLFYTPPADKKELFSSRPARGLSVPGLSLIGHFVAWSPYLGKKPLEYMFNLPGVCDGPSSVFIADEGNHTTLLMVAAGFISDGAIYDNEYFATWRRKAAYEFILSTFPEPEHINMKDNWGSTALHLAAWTGNLDIATMLIDHGAELNAVDFSGCTPLDVLFHNDPPYLEQDRDSKKIMTDNFEKGRSGIYTVLKSKGGIHKIRVVDSRKMTDDFLKSRS
jgi:ankyrin repeat protein